MRIHASKKKQAKKYPINVHPIAMDKSEYHIISRRFGRTSSTFGSETTLTIYTKKLKDVLPSPLKEVTDDPPIDLVLRP